MAFTNETTHYGLPQWIGSDKPTYLVDQNNAYQKIDSEIYNANVAAGQAVTTAEGAVSTAGSAASSAAEALSTAQTASSTANDALAAAQTANTNAQSAQTAAGAAQTAAEAAQTAAAGNSITNLAPAYDPTITYNIGDLVTAEGKLYKCIVAVVTPMDFDINYWDDITVSEVIGEGSGVDGRLDALESNMTTVQSNITSLGTRLTTAEHDINELEDNIYISSTRQSHVHTAVSNYTAANDGLYYIQYGATNRQDDVYCALNGNNISYGVGMVGFIISLKAGSVISFSNNCTYGLIDIMS